MKAKRGRVVATTRKDGTTVIEIRRITYAGPYHLHENITKSSYDRLLNVLFRWEFEFFPTRNIIGFDAVKN